MQLVITPGGDIRCIYGELIDVRALGEPQIRRASQVEPDESGRWRADLSPVGGPLLGPFERRTEALDAEEKWLQAHWLEPQSEPGSSW